MHDINVKRVVIFIFLSSMCLKINAELLVAIQKGSKYSLKGSYLKIGPGYENLMDHYKEIQKILLNSQWPTSILNSAQSEILDEEIFVNNKIKETLRSDSYYQELQNDAKEDEEETEEYKVFFFPTTLYELFVISYVYSERVSSDTANNPLHEALISLQTFNPDNKFELNIPQIIESQKERKEIIIDINSEFKKANDIFTLFPQKKRKKLSPYLSVNFAISEWLFRHFPDLKEPDIDISQKIKQAIPQIIDRLIKECQSIHYKTEEHNNWFYEWAREKRREIGNSFGKSDCIYNAIDTFKHSDVINLIADVVALEYEAKELNKALLMRGTSLIKLEKEHMSKDIAEKTMVGSTIQSTEWVDTEKEDDFKRITAEKAYYKGVDTPYSISFGNSLFGGVFRDCGACVYTYLTDKPSDSKLIGYALLIDKKSYMHNHNSNLFFIPPLCPLAAMFMKGEYFHPRTKIATQDFEKKILAKGLFDAVQDRNEIIIIKRDPFKHGALFSRFIAENGRIIQKGDKGSLSDGERAIIDNMKDVQLSAAEHYETMHFLKPRLKKWVGGAQERLSARKEEGLSVEPRPQEKTPKPEPEMPPTLEQEPIQEEGMSFEEFKRNLKSDITSSEKELNVYRDLSTTDDRRQQLKATMTKRYDEAAEKYKRFIKNTEKQKKELYELLDQFQKLTVSP